jgi:trehalose 6-phosphate phosphatase
MHRSQRTAKLEPETYSTVEKVFDRLANVLNQRKVFIGLDRDGTLVPHSDRPEEARVDNDLRQLIGRLAKVPGFRVAVISARSVAQLRSDFDPSNLFLAGNYGMEISSPGGEFSIHPLALKAVPLLRDVRDRLAFLVCADVKAILEDHGYSLCLHWQSVAAEKRQLVHDAIFQMKAQFSQLQFLTLPTSYEVKPKMPWTKASSLTQIFMQAQADLSNAYPIYAGDSQADEPAFGWVNARGGTSIKVGSGGLKTCSEFQLADTSDLRCLLQRILELRSARA